MIKKQMKKSPFSLSGFTLVELIVVISILAILGTISFISFSGYLSSSRDSKRISNTAVITKGFDIALITGTPVNASKTATGYNIAIAGSGLTMTGYYGIVNDALLQSIKVFGKDIAVYDGFQEYRYGYFPDQKKFQVLAMLENAENARSTFILPSIIDQAFAEVASVGYAYIKGNFTSTGGINNIVVDPTIENNKVAVNGIKTFSGATETVTIAAPLALVVATSVPADGVCADVASYTATPTLLCKTGTLTGSIVDNGGVTGKWTWACNGVNGGAATTANSCSANFDNSIRCVFDTDTVNGKFGDGTTNYCTFAP